MYYQEYQVRVDVLVWRKSLVWRLKEAVLGTMRARQRRTPVAVLGKGA